MAKEKLNIAGLDTGAKNTRKQIRKASDGAEAVAPRPIGRPRKTQPVVLINTAYDEENYLFLKQCSAAGHRSITSLVNEIIYLYRAEHPDIAKMAADFAKKFEKASGIPFQDNRK